MIELTGNNVVLVGIVAVIGLAALVVAGILVRGVLAASEGTERMKEIGLGHYDKSGVAELTFKGRNA